MPTTIQPVLLTPDIERLQAFYSGLLGAQVAMRLPEQGPAFYLGLTVGDGELGLVADDSVAADTLQRVLISIDVTGIGGASLDDVLAQVEGLGGRVLAEPNDMPWGQRVAHILDPDGNAVNLTSPVTTTAAAPG